MTTATAAMFSRHGEIGTTGLNRFGGYVYEEFLRELRGKRAVEVYREMSNNDATIGAMLFAIKMLMRQAEWPIEPFSDAPEDVANAEFLESCLEDMDQPWTDTLGEILSMLPYGWCWNEIVYKTRQGPLQLDPNFHSKFNDGRTGWRKLPIRAQDSLWMWDFAPSGDIKGMFQVAPPDYMIRYLPWEKSLLFRPEATKGNPEGRSVLRNAYRSWYMKKHVENIEAIGIERDLAGLPIAWVPPDMLEPDAPPERLAILDAVRRIVTNIKRDEQEGLVFPLLYDDNGNKAYDLTLLSTGSRRQFDTTAIIGRWDQRILMTVLADFILLGHTKVGTFSLSSSKTELFASAIGAWMDAIAEVMNRQAIPRLFAFNGLPLDRLPRLTHGDIESADLGELGTFIQTLASAGAQIFPNPELENHLLKQAGLPAVQDTEHLGVVGDPDPEELELPPGREEADPLDVPDPNAPPPVPAKGPQDNVPGAAA